jgi:hypothetical protein
VEYPADDEGNPVADGIDEKWQEQPPKNRAANAPPQGQLAEYDCKRIAADERL